MTEPLEGSIRLEGWLVGTPQFEQVLDMKLHALKREFLAAQTRLLKEAPCPVSTS